MYAGARNGQRSPSQPLVSSKALNALDEVGGGTRESTTHLEELVGARSLDSCEGGEE